MSDLLDVCVIAVLVVTTIVLSVHVGIGFGAGRHASARERTKGSDVLRELASRPRWTHARRPGPHEGSSE